MILSSQHMNVRYVNAVNKSGDYESFYYETWIDSKIGIEHLDLSGRIGIQFKNKFHIPESVELHISPIAAFAMSLVQSPIGNLWSSHVVAISSHVWL